jgi:hypothetical protein
MNNVSRLDPASNRNPIVFRMNRADWWAGYDFDSVKLAFAQSVGYLTLAEAEAANIFESPRPISARDLDAEVTEGVTCRQLLQALCDVNAEFPCFFSSIARSDLWSSVRIAAPALNPLRQAA